MKEIKAEGNYDIPAYATENVEELEAEEKKAKEEADENLRKAAQKKLDSIINDLKAKGLSDEEIRKEISNGFVVSEEEVEQAKEE
jgi:acetamidase/formamidase